MTAEAMRDAHNRLADEVARQLVSEGYEVFVEPGLHLLPRELRGFQPDILARRGDENLVVEVKLVPDRAGADQVARMSRAVQSIPGWHFRLVSAPKPEPSCPWSLADAENRIGEAERLAGQGYHEAALILLVAAAEAVGRRLAATERVRVQPWSPLTLFRELVHHGLIDREDAELLERASVARNRMIHGIADTAVEPAEVTALARIVRCLAQEAHQTEAPPATSEPSRHAV